MFKKVTPLVLARHFSVAQSQAKDWFDCSHAPDQTGAAHEDVQPWAQHFFPLFEALQNLETSRNARTPRKRQMHMGDFNVEVLGDETMNESNNPIVTGM